MSIEVEISKELHDFNLEVQLKSFNKTIGFLGASGSGKSLTLRCIAGLMTPDRGRIVLGGKVLFDSEKGINLSPQERKTGFLFQNYALFPNMTVSENIGLSLRKLPQKERSFKIEEKLKMMQIKHLQNMYPSELSGGQQQRAALARALVLEPEILLLDEPFSALDNHLRRRLERELLRVLADYQGTVVFVTHDLDECYRVCEDVLIMGKGKVVACGPKEKVFFHPPNIESAEILGFKNITAFEKEAQHNWIKAKGWDCSLEIASSDLISGGGYLGIKGNELILVDRPEKANTFPCWVTQTIETPRTATLLLSLNRPPRNPEDYHLEMEVERQNYLSFRARPFPWYVRIQPEKLLCFSAKD